MCTRASQSCERFREVRQLRPICHPELKGRGWGCGASKRRKLIHSKMGRANVCETNVCHTMQRPWGTEWNQQTGQEPPHLPPLIPQTLQLSVGGALFLD